VVTPRATTATAATRTVAEASTQTDSTQTDECKGVILVAVHEAAVQAEMPPSAPSWAREVPPSAPSWAREVPPSAPSWAREVPPSAPKAREAPVQADMKLPSDSAVARGEEGVHQNAVMSAVGVQRTAPPPLREEVAVRPMPRPMPKSPSNTELAQAHATSSDPVLSLLKSRIETCRAHLRSLG